MFNRVSPVQPPRSVCQHRWFLHLSVFGGLLWQRTHLLAQESPAVQGSHVLQLQTLQEDEDETTFILEPPLEPDMAQTTGTLNSRESVKTIYATLRNFRTYWLSVSSSDFVQLGIFWPVNQLCLSLFSEATLCCLFVVC